MIAHWDDGAPNWEVSLDMLRQAQKDGITEIVCTPHFLSQADLDREEEIWALYEELVEHARSENIPITIHMGGELYLQPELKLDQKVSTFAQNGRYFLVEFPMALIPDHAPQMFFNYLMDGNTPVLAHPERNGGFIESPDKAYDFVERGTLLQVTAGSLLGNFGSQVKNLAFKLLDANLVHVVATDAHNLTSRPLLLKSAYNLVAETWGTDRAELLFNINPKKLIQGQDISIGDAKPVAEEANKGFSSKLRSLFSK